MSNDKIIDFVWGKSAKDALSHSKKTSYLKGSYEFTIAKETKLRKNSREYKLSSGLKRYAIYGHKK
jgi:hypothetical protein